REGMTEIVDPPRRIDPRGLLRGSPLEGAEVVDVEVTTPLPGKQQRRTREVLDPFFARVAEDEPVAPLVPRIVAANGDSWPTTRGHGCWRFMVRGSRCSGSTRWSWLWSPAG